MDHEQVKALLRKLLEEEGAKGLAKRLGVTRQNIWAVLVGKWQTGGKLLEALGIEAKVTFKLDRQRPCQRMTARDRKLYLEAVKLSRAKVIGAIRRGELPRLSKVEVLCVDCRRRRATDYDHRDYAKPLEVEPVCHWCNKKRGPALCSTIPTLTAARDKAPQSVSC